MTPWISTMLSLTTLVFVGPFASAQAPRSAAAAVPSKDAPGYTTDLLKTDCRDPDFIGSTVAFDNLTRQATAFRAPDLSGARQDFATKFMSGDLKAADLELNKYSNYYEEEFYKVVQPGEQKLNEIIGRGEIAESPYKSAVGVSHAWEKLIVENLRALYDANQAFEDQRRRGDLDRKDAAEAYGVKIAYIKLMTQMKTRAYPEVWKQALFRLCGKFSANANFGDTKVRVVGCGAYHPDASWQRNPADGKEDASQCHIPVKCLTTYQLAKPGQAGAPVELPDTHFFSVSCPRSSCSDMKACVQSEGAQGSVPLQRLAPTKAVQ